MYVNKRVETQVECGFHGGDFAGFDIHAAQHGILKKIVFCQIMRKLTVNRFNIETFLLIQIGIEKDPLVFVGVECGKGVVRKDFVRNRPVSVNRYGLYDTVRNNIDGCERCFFAFVITLAGKCAALSERMQHGKQGCIKACEFAHRFGYGCCRRNRCRCGCCRCGCGCLLRVTAGIAAEAENTCRKQQRKQSEQRVIAIA